MPESIYDLAIIGGGINGVGIAAEAASRGLSVLLVEMGDLGGATSSASSKLVHGGLRYLEHFELRLVRDALREREVLLAKAPHIVAPLRFVLPHVAGMRPRAMIAAGLMLYDRLATRIQIPGSRRIDLHRDPAGCALRADLRQGFAYWDCWVDDARLVALNARAAARDGAHIATRTRLTRLETRDGSWLLSLATDSGTRQVAARAIVNAAGPWVDAVAAMAETATGGGERPVGRRRLRLVKGSHIVVPRLPGAEDAYLLQSPAGDGRVVFALPFEERFTLIGTTDVAYDGDPAAVAISAEEEDYLIAAVSRYVARGIGKYDIVWRYAGVRPLFDDGSKAASAVTRDFKLELVAGQGAPARLNVLGGKLTTYRKLAEQAITTLQPWLSPLAPARPPEYPLPGGDVGPGGIAGYRLDLGRRRPGFSQAALSRLARRYGTLADDLLGDAQSEADLGRQLGGGLSEREVHYLKAEEWAREPQDVLWRRTKAGLHIEADDRARASEAIAKLL